MSVSARAGSIASSAAAMGALQMAVWPLSSQLPVGSRFPLAASAIFAAVMLLAIRKLEGHHPFDRFGPANLVTTLRAALAALVAGLAGEPPLPAVAAAAAAIAFAAMASDGLDGWLARRSGMASRFGARFDLEIDALLILALAILVWRHDKAAGGSCSRDCSVICSLPRVGSGRGFGSRCRRAGGVRRSASSRLPV
jgi:phosphatidylglycerophosphate synthase